MNKRELNDIKKVLVEKRDDLLKLVNNTRANDIEENNTGDEADVASGSIEKELLFELNDNERIMLDAIEAALRKIENNTYGSCENCKKGISKQRLAAIPFARYCIECQTKSDR